MLYSATRCFTFLCLIVFSFTVLTLPLTALAGGSKVEVCHIPPDDPDNFHTISINSKALNAHLNHLDLEGACNGICAEICDDGDACTIDDSGDCEVFGCPAEPELVDCDDGDMCTVDSCDSEFGCTSEPKCAEGFTCNPDDGSCVAEVSCPGDFADLLALDFADSEGVLSACGDGLIADGTINWFDNGAYYCSGSEGCVESSPGVPATGWGYLREFNGSSWESSDLYIGLTPEEDAACRALLNANCASDEQVTEDQAAIPAPMSALD